jgi:hypothetical protein
MNILQPIPRTIKRIQTERARSKNSTTPHDLLRWAASSFQDLKLHNVIALTHDTTFALPFSAKVPYPAIPPPDCARSEASHQGSARKFTKLQVQRMQATAQFQDLRTADPLLVAYGLMILKICLRDTEHPRPKQFREGLGNPPFVPHFLTLPSGYDPPPPVQSGSDKTLRSQARRYLIRALGTCPLPHK